MAWSSDGSKFFYIDSLVHTVDVFDYDIRTGTASNRRVLFDLKKNGIKGIPDGMCIDSNNNIWVAVFFGAKVCDWEMNLRNDFGWKPADNGVMYFRFSILTRPQEH